MLPLFPPIENLDWLIRLREDISTQNGFRAEVPNFLGIEAYFCPDCYASGMVRVDRVVAIVAEAPSVLCYTNHKRDGGVPCQQS